MPPRRACCIAAEVRRAAVVAEVWDHIRTHDPQDPADRRTIVADDKLRAVFGRDLCTMFEMQKPLSPHLGAP